MNNRINQLFERKKENILSVYFTAGFPNLNDTVEIIQELEKELGMRVMAYSTPSVPSDLSSEQLKKVEQLENKLCVRLVAYKNH